MRHHQEHDFVVRNGVILGAEDVFENGNRAQAGDAAPADLVLLVQDAAEDVGLAFAQADDLFRALLGDDGLGDAVDGLTFRFPR